MYVMERCAAEFESSLLDSTISYIKSHFLNWLQVIFGKQHHIPFPVLEIVVGHRTFSDQN